MEPCLKGPSLIGPIVLLEEPVPSRRPLSLVRLFSSNRVEPVSLEARSSRRAQPYLRPSTMVVSRRSYVESGLIHRDCALGSDSSVVTVMGASS